MNNLNFSDKNVTFIHVKMGKGEQGGGQISPKVFCQKKSAILADSAIFAHSAIWKQKEKFVQKMKTV